MRFLVRNLHIFVFAVLSMATGVLVSTGPEKAVAVMRPVVEDTAAAKDLARGAFYEITQVSWDEVADEAVSIYVATLRMPTMLFERLSEKLEKVEMNMVQRTKAGPLADPADLEAFRKTRFDLVKVQWHTDRRKILQNSSTAPSL